MKLHSTVDAVDFTAGANAEMGLVGRFVAGWRKRADARRVRDALSDLDDAMLLDIGVAEDEISRVRAGECFTPRAWNRETARKAA